MKESSHTRVLNWTGPNQIDEVVGRGTFQLCHHDDNSKLLSTLYNMHASRSIISVNLKWRETTNLEL